MKKGNYRLMVAVNEELLLKYFRCELKRARLVFSNRERAIPLSFDEDKVVVLRDERRYEYRTEDGRSLQEFKNEQESMRYNWLRMLFIFDTEAQMKASPYYDAAKPRNRKSKRGINGTPEFISNMNKLNASKVLTFSTKMEEKGRMYNVVSTEAKDAETGEWYVIQRTRTLVF